MSMPPNHDRSRRGRTVATSDINCSAKNILIRILLMMLICSMMYLLLNSFFVRGSDEAKPPNIIFILADDLGWNDVSFHGSPQIPTPNLDALAASGIVLSRHYVAPQCTPTRASLMTAKYPTNTGLQHLLIRAGQPSGLPLNFTIMPQHFKRLGYATHLVGKWHLGFYKKEFTPIYRGFDSAFGYWNGQIDHYDHTNYEGDENFWGVDLHDGLKTIMHLRSNYAAGIFTEKAVEIIRKHNSSKPLFLYLAQIVPHSGNPYQRLQAPPEHVARFPHIRDKKRRNFAGAVSALDESIGMVYAALHDEGMLDNSIIVFISDNGAEIEGQEGGHGSNWPLRGTKYRLFEGGVRVPSLIWSPLLRLQQPRISAQLMHISDWLPTLYAAAGGDVRDLGSTDGMDMWKHLLRDLPSPRNEILLNVDPVFRMYSLIQNDYKLVNGTYPDDDKDLWYGPSGREDLNVPSLDEWVWKNGSVVKDILQRTGRWLIRVANQWRQKAVVDCGLLSPPTDNGGCNSTAPCLFNIKEDPCEYRNMASQRPQVVEDMIKRVRELNSTSLEALNPETDPNADPRCHGFSFVPWRDPEHSAEPCGLLN